MTKLNIWWYNHIQRHFRYIISLYLWYKYYGTFYNCPKPGKIDIAAVLWAEHIIKKI